MLDFTDQIGRPLCLSSSPRRIVSLVPSITETLIDFGLENKVVGRTKFCIHPGEKVKHIQRIGGTKKVNIEKVKELKPDLIIANKEENTKEDVEQLMAIAPVYVSRIITVSDALDMMTMLARICQVTEHAAPFIKCISEGFQSRNKALSPRILYLIWKDPYMSIGGDTFIHNVLGYAGFDNVMSNTNRYPEVMMQDIDIADVDAVFLSSEPYPFQEKHFSQFPEKLQAKLHLVDGELFSWYGTRMVKAINYMDTLYQKVVSSTSI